MDAIVTAGGIPKPEDPLYANTPGAPKAMLEIAGKPMIQWVLDALSDSKHITQVIVIGLEKECGITCTKPLDFISNQGAYKRKIQFSKRELKQIYANSSRWAELEMKVYGDLLQSDGHYREYLVNPVLLARDKLKMVLRR